MSSMGLLHHSDITCILTVSLSVTSLLRHHSVVPSHCYAGLKLPAGQDITLQSLFDVGFYPGETASLRKLCNTQNAIWYSVMLSGYKHVTVSWFVANKCRHVTVSGCKNLMLSL